MKKGEVVGIDLTTTTLMRKLSKILIMTALCLSLASCSIKKGAPDTTANETPATTETGAVSQTAKSNTKTIIFDTNYLAGDIDGTPIISGSIVPVGGAVNIYPVEEFSQIVSIEVNGMIYAGNAATYIVGEDDPDEIRVVANFADMEEPAVATEERAPVDPEPDPLSQPSEEAEIPDILRIGGFRFAQPSDNIAAAYIEGKSYECFLSEDGSRCLRVSQYTEGAGDACPYKSNDYNNYTDYMLDVAGYELGSQTDFQSVAAEVGGQPALFITVNGNEGNSYAVMYIKSPDGSDSDFARFSYSVSGENNGTGSLTDQLIAIISDIRLSK